jgi:7,8-dihydro-6-hydroxymethylpterin dimethyltransferase
MPETAFNLATQSLCPTCLGVVEGSIVSHRGAVYLRKTCSEHGQTGVRIWPDADHYLWMRSFRTPFVPPRASVEAGNGCPGGCGPCGAHLRKPTLVEIELTTRCNLQCPVCFMSAAGGTADVGFEELRRIYASILEELGTSIGVQLTGGEPTVRSDLPDVVRLGRTMGLSAIEINTNGLAIARQPHLLEELRDAGATGMYLQFDGLTSEVYRAIRGRDVLAEKLAAVERCREAGIQAVLAMTVIRGINEDQIGAVLGFALNNLDVVAGLALQPAFASGRFDVRRCDPLTMGDAIFLLAAQSGGLIAPYDLWPLGCSHPLCSAGTYLAETEGHALYPVTRLISQDEYLGQFDPDSPQGAVFADILAKRNANARRGLSIVVMNYMDAWGLDLERLRECSMVVKTVSGRTIPFCAYHLTSAAGERMFGAPAGKGHAIPDTERSAHAR